MTFELLNCEFLDRRVAVYLQPDWKPSLVGRLLAVIHEDAGESLAVIAEDDGTTYRVRASVIDRLELAEIETDPPL